MICGGRATEEMRPVIDYYEKLEFRLDRHINGIPVQLLPKHPAWNDLPPRTCLMPSKVYRHLAMKKYDWRGKKVVFNTFI